MVFAYDYSIGNKKLKNKNAVIQWVIKKSKKNQKK